MSVGRKSDFTCISLRFKIDSRMFLGAGSCLSPFIAGYIVQATNDWRWVYGMNCILVGTNLILMILFMPETNFNREVAMTNPSIAKKTFFQYMSVTGGYDRRCSWFRSLWTPFTLLKYPALPWAILNFGVLLGWVSPHTSPLIVVGCNVYVVFEFPPCSTLQLCPDKRRIDLYFPSYWCDTRDVLWRISLRRINKVPRKTSQRCIRA